MAAGERMVEVVDAGHSVNGHSSSFVNSSLPRRWLPRW